MHHAFINGRYIPVHFAPTQKTVLDALIQQIISTPLSTVLKNYEKPFLSALHAKIGIKNLRLKKNSPFEKLGIATLAESKFSTAAAKSDIGINEREKAANEHIKSLGWRDYAQGAVFAFSKLIKCDYLEIFLNEIELYTLSLVYDFDDIFAIFGESTINFEPPPDYVTLQSNILFQQKSDFKEILKNYEEGKPYEKEVPSSTPANLISDIKSGTIERTFVESYYTAIVKGNFNGIYGTQAQDVYKPDFMCENGVIAIDKKTQVCEKTWNNVQPDEYKILYTYGMRIVGGSRLHLILAIILLHAQLGDKIKILGGDTDSLKIACAQSITNNDLLNALKPLHTAIFSAINRAQKRVRECFANDCSDLDNVGFFEVEKCGKTYRYTKHMELWNKCRVSVDSDDVPHITCAGLPQPHGKYNINDFYRDLRKKGCEVDDILHNLITYNTIVSNNVCHSLEQHRPKPTDKFCGWVTDYRGQTAYVDAYQSIALYNYDRYLGDTFNRANFESAQYLKSKGLSATMTKRYYYMMR